VDLLCTQQASGHIRVSLQDTGEGLSAAKLAQRAVDASRCAAGSCDSGVRVQKNLPNRLDAKIFGALDVSVLSTTWKA